MNTYICAPTEEDAAARAAESNITDGFKRVGPEPRDVEGIEGGLLFSSNWRETFAPVSSEVGVMSGMDASAFLATARKNKNLAIEVV